MYLEGEVAPLLVLSQRATSNLNLQGLSPLVRRHRLNNSRPTSPLLEKLTLELLLRRLRLRDSAGSAGCNPLARACRLRMSVKLTTPTSLPDILAPGNAEAGIDGVTGEGRPAEAGVGLV